VLAADGGGRVAVTGAGATTPSGSLTVRAADRSAQEDARAASWSGAGEAAVSIAGDQPVDLSRESNGDLALGFAVRVDRAPSAAVTLAVDCGDGCSGELDVTEAVSGAPPGEWTDVRIRLRCFAEAGADMTRVTAPLRISTSGTLELSFADVRLVSAAEGQADCP
jgi:beta-glucosidase